MGSLPASQRPMRICADASPPPPPGGCEYLPGREGERGGGRMGKGGRTASGRPAGRLPQVHNQTWANHAAAAASRIPALPARHSGGGDRGGGPAPVLVEVRGGRATGRGGEGPAGRGGGRAGGGGGGGGGGRVVPPPLHAAKSAPGGPTRSAGGHGGADATGATRAGGGSAAAQIWSGGGGRRPVVWPAITPRSTRPPLPHLQARTTKPPPPSSIRECGQNGSTQQPRGGTKFLISVQRPTSPPPPTPPIAHAAYTGRRVTDDRLLPARHHHLCTRCLGWFEEISCHV